MNSVYVEYFNRTAVSWNTPDDYFSTCEDVLREALELGWQVRLIVWEPESTADTQVWENTQ